MQMDNRPVTLEDINMKEIYKYILDKEKTKPPTSKQRWNEKYDDMDLDENYWQQIIETPFHLTNNSKVLLVQYKLVQHILMVNCNLKKWNQISSSECELCGKQDSLEHFIYECPTANALWLSINSWWKTEFAFSIPLSILEVLFGVPNEIVYIHLNML